MRKKQLEPGTKRPKGATPRVRRRRRPSPSDEEVLRKALNLFYERGFEGTSIDAITAAAGVAKRTVYLRYSDKLSLFKAALERAIEEWIVPVERLREAESATLDESLHAVGQILVENLMSRAGLRLVKLANAESIRMPEIAAFCVKRGTEPTMAYLADLFRRHLGENSPGFPEAEEAAEAFMYLVVGGPANSAAWGLVRDKAAVDRRVAFSIDLFLNGLPVPSRTHGIADPSTTPEEETRRTKSLLMDVKKQLDESLRRLDQNSKSLTKTKSP